MADVFPSGGNHNHPLGRGIQGGAERKGGGLVTESGTADMRDKGGTNEPIHAHRVTPPIRPGRGMHDTNKLGG